MSGDPFDVELLHRLAEISCDRDLDAQETASLERILRESAEARRLYLEHVDLHAVLFSQDGPDELLSGPAASETDTSPALDSVAPAPALSRRKLLLSRILRHEHAVAITAGFVFTVALLGWMARTYLPSVAKQKDQKPAAAVSTSESIATLTNWHRPEWVKEHAISPRNHRITAGQRVAFTSGLVEITYDTGAQVVIEGPAEFVVGDTEAEGAKAQSQGIVRSSSLQSSTHTTHPSANSGFLALGRLVARCETPRSKGFTIVTTNGAVEDLSTEFAVETTLDGTCSAHVVEGRVRAQMVTRDGQMQTAVFVKDEGFVMDPSSGIRREQIADATRFVSQMPKPVEFTGQPDILRVDFQAADESRLQKGFRPFTRADAAHGKTYDTSGGTLLVGVAGLEGEGDAGFHARDILTNSPRLKAAALYDDFVFNNTGGKITLTIQGIQANRDYRIRLFSYDRFDDGAYPQFHTNHFNAAAETSGSTATVTFDRTVAPQHALQHSGTITVRSTTDTLTIDVEPEDDSLTRLNGFELFEIQKPDSSTGKEE